MSPRNFSLFLAGLIWISVGIRIGSRGIHWLAPYFEKPDWHLALLIVSLAVAFLKASTVLKKAAHRNIGNLENIDNNNPADYLLGVFKLFGIKGFVMISIMIGIGFGLRHLREFHAADPYNLFGFIYLAIALGLAGSSLHYFQAIRK